MILEKSPLSKLVLGLSSQTQTDPQDSNTIKPHQIMSSLLYTTDAAAE